MRRLLATTLVVLVGCGDDAAAPPDAALPESPLTLRVLSSRPDTVTAGDALIEIAHPADVDGSTISVLADGRDVTAAFGDSDGTRRIGLVDGLALGAVTISAQLPGHTDAELGLTTYPASGPVLSGPHQAPFLCRTEEAGLGPPTDASTCAVATRYEYFYKTTANTFVALTDPAQVPGDAAKVMRADGVMIDYVVQVERGTLNRAIYQITTLYDRSAWNKKLIYSFKGGCGVGHHQGVLQATDDLLGGVAPLADSPVAAGFAIASASLNTFGVACNDVLAAETAMMVKERFIEQVGVPLYTTGWGGSGGSIQQHLIAENYPGILDGIVPGISYPDVFTIYPDVMDCPLLVDYFANRDGGRFDDAVDQADVTGYANAMTCTNWNGLLGHLEDPTTGCDPAVPLAARYHPTTNPTGVRCTFVETNKNLIGNRRIYDNVGVQYGLAALEAGTITKDQFLHLNETIGGYGVDGARVATRSSADSEGLRAAYQGGRVVRGNLGLNELPIVDLRIYTDQLGDIHDRVRTDTTRARLVRANGDADNHVFVISPLDQTAYVRASFAAIIVIDAWLTAFVADTRADRAAAVRATRPANLVDACVGATGDPVPAAACDAQLPTHRSTRLIAGAPETNDVLECQLKTPVMSDYSVTFTAPEWARLMAAFPSGVCDYDQPGVEHVAATGTWQSFGPKP